MNNGKDFLASLPLCVIATQSGWLSVDDFNIGFPNFLAMALLRMVRDACLRESKEQTDEVKSPKKKRKNLYISSKKPKNAKDWWESPYYRNVSTQPKRRLAERAGIGERTYLGHKILPPDLGVEV